MVNLVDIFRVRPVLIVVSSLLLSQLWCSVGVGVKALVVYLGIQVCQRVNVLPNSSLRGTSNNRGTISIYMF
jgi:hypothetical protein